MDKRQRLVESAFELFYRQGIHAVGINQILQTTGIAKKTLYHHFDSKASLIAAVLAYRDDKFYSWLAGRVEQVESGREGIIALFDALDDWINNREPSLACFHGCFFINACAEYGDPDQWVHQLSARHKKRIKDLITQQVATLNLTHQYRELLVDTICILKEGSIVQAHVAGDYQAACKAKQTLLLLLDSISNE